MKTSPPISPWHRGALTALLACGVAMSHASCPEQQEAAAERVFDQADAVYARTPYGQDESKAKRSDKTTHYVFNGKSYTAQD